MVDAGRQNLAFGRRAKHGRWRPPCLVRFNAQGRAFWGWKNTMGKCLQNQHERDGASVNCNGALAPAGGQKVSESLRPRSAIAGSTKFYSAFIDRHTIRGNDIKTLLSVRPCSPRDAVGVNTPKSHPPGGGLISNHRRLPYHVLEFPLYCSG